MKQKLGVTPWRLGLGEQDMVTAVIATPAVSVSFPASVGPGDTACFTVTSFRQLQKNNGEKKTPYCCKRNWKSCLSVYPANDFMMPLK